MKSVNSPIPGAKRESERPGQAGESRCPECGRDAADTSIPRPSWNSWRRMLPIVLLALATGYVVLMTMPLSHKWITGQDHSMAYPAKYNGKAGFELGIHPHLVTPASLRAIADGTWPTDELRAMVKEYAEQRGYAQMFVGVPTQMMLSVGTRHARVDKTVQYGLPFHWFYTYEGEEYEDYFDPTHVSPPLTETAYDFSRFWWMRMRGDAADNRFHWIGVAPFAFAAAAGLGWFVWSVAGWCSRRRWVRLAALAVYIVVLGIGAAHSRTSFELQGFGPHPPLTPMGLTRDRFVAASESEAGLRGLAGTMLAAIPDGTDPEGVVYLGQLTPVASDWSEDWFGPVLLGFSVGYYDVSSFYAYDEAGQRLGPAELSPVPAVTFFRDIVGFNRGRGNTRSSLVLYPTTVVLFLTLLALVYSVPRWLFAFAARRRHRSRLRLGLCPGCGYRTLTR